MKKELPRERSVQVELQRNHVTSIIKEYHEKQHTPDLILATFQEIWAYRGLLIADSLPQPFAPIRQLNRAHEQIIQLESAGRRLGYMPPELSTQEDRHLMGAMFPEMSSHSVIDGNPISNERVYAGWFSYETDINPPYLGTSEVPPSILASQGRHTMNLSEYIICGQDSKLLIDKYLDQDGTWTALPASHYAHGIVYGNFKPNGKLSVIRWAENPESPLQLFPHWGWRTVGVN